MSQSNQAILPFTPTLDVVVIVNSLLDIYERRDGAPKQTVRVKLEQLAADLPGYFSQIDPLPRVTANEQLAALEKRGLLYLGWEPGQTGHLLAAVSLEASRTGLLYTLLKRQPLAEQRARLRDLLLADRFRLAGWRLRAVEHCLAQLQAHRSSAPFSLTNEAWNRDLLAALVALPGEATTEERPYRVFSVRLFNDSKRFDALKNTVARLARRYKPAWRDLTLPETLRELGLVANPDHLYLFGPWQLVDAEGQVVSLAEFYPSVGIPAALAAQVQQARVDAPRVVCVENLASFYELVRHEGGDLATLCLWGNPSPAARHLLRRLADSLAEDAPLYLWADIDYGGLNILAHLRQNVSPRFLALRMDCATLDQFARWGHPLTQNDRRNLARLRQHAALADMAPVIDHMLLNDLKLEQEAIVLAGAGSVEPL